MNYTSYSVGRNAMLLGIVLALLQVSIGRSQNRPTTWLTEGFDAFMKGEFEPNNLYVSRHGRLQTIHRFDVNNDGYYDLIFNNTHDISYEIPAYRYSFERGRNNPVRTDYPGVGSAAVRVTELNGDGAPDLVVARGFDDTTHLQNSWIYWGGPDGWSGRRHSELPTPYVHDVCIADLNRDGRPDLVFIGGSAGGDEPEAPGSNRSFIYWGGVNGFSYDHEMDFPTPDANGCLTGDFNGDGFLDLLVTATNHHSAILWGGPDGVAANSAKSAVDSATGAALLGSRLVLATPNQIEITSWQNRSRHVDQTIPFEGGERLAVADLNHDGVNDLVVARAVKGNNWQPTSRIFWGKKQSGREVFSNADHTDLNTSGAVDVAIADIDGDGFPDIAFANSRTHLSYDIPSSIYWGGPDGYSESRRSDLPTHGAQSVAVLGKDVFFANSQSGRPLGDIDAYVYFGSKDGSYSTQHMQRLPTEAGYESCIADLNDDGYADLLLVSSHEGDSHSPTGSFIYWGGSDGLSPSRRAELPTHGAIGCAVADLNRDGYLDVLFANLDDGTASIFYGGPEGFKPTHTFSFKSNGGRYPAIADLNKDGYLDLLIPSITDGLYIYWGSAYGYQQSNSTLLPATGPVSTQIADLNGDGYLDLVVCGFADLRRWAFHGVNSVIYWGSAKGYSEANSTPLPSTGAHHAAIADFNRDGFLDIFISNYHSDFTRNLDSYIYWGSIDSNYSAAHRQALHVGSAAGVISADLKGDGWIDLAVSNHVVDGNHHTNSPIFWNGPSGFSERARTEVPTVGPHMMNGVDQGNLYSRKMQEIFTSEIYDAGQPAAPAELEWEGVTPFGSKLGFDLRGADSAAELRHSAWTTLGLQSAEKKSLPVGKLAPRRFWQYRVTLAEGRASSPALDRVAIIFDGQSP